MKKTLIILTIAMLALSSCVTLIPEAPISYGVKMSYLSNNYNGKTISGVQDGDSFVYYPLQTVNESGDIVDTDKWVKTAGNNLVGFNFISIAEGFGTTVTVNKTPYGTMSVFAGAGKTLPSIVADELTFPWLNTNAMMASMTGQNLAAFTEEKGMMVYTFTNEYPIAVRDVVFAEAIPAGIKAVAAYGIQGGMYKATDSDNFKWEVKQVKGVDYLIIKITLDENNPIMGPMPWTKSCAVAVEYELDN